MSKYLLVTIITFIILGGNSCKAPRKAFTDFVPQGYILYKKYSGDLNNDGQVDLVLMIKGTDKKNVAINRFGKEVDQNRRGIIVLLNKKGRHKVVVSNYACFYSENEDGGVYYAPQLSIDIEKGNLCINYAHGRYGSWKYTFQYGNSHFNLINYDATEGGAITSSETHINFLTKKKLFRKNINDDSEGNDEIFKDTWTDIKQKKLIKLSNINDFEELTFFKTSN